MDNDIIIADRADCLYGVGSEATFNIQLNGDPDEATLCLSNDGYRIIRQHPLELNDGKASITYTLTEPGVLRCRVNCIRGEERFSLIAAAAFDPFSIEPTTLEPEDFDQFWSDQKSALSAIPMDVQLEPVFELPASGSCEVWKISLANINGTRVYGYLAKPKTIHGRLPAVLTLQNHGGGAWSVPVEWVTSFAEKGFIAMAINAHDVENGMEKDYYRKLNLGPLASYTLHGFLDRNDYYFKAVFMRVVRSIDYLTSMDDWDEKSMILTGRSQGGGLSIVGAGLDSRVTGFVCAVPALCEHGGHKFGRPAGWPRFVPVDEHDYGRCWLTASTGDGHGPVSKRVLDVSRYYDAVNFARKIKCPSVINLGLIDTCVPPTTVFSAFNVIKAPKELIVSKDLGHGADRNPDYRRDERIIELVCKSGSVLR